jgi:transcriptional regulator with XRE-family HTH domain
MVCDLRTVIGWSQRTLARQAGVSQPWVSLVKRGENAPSGRHRSLTFGVFRAAFDGVEFWPCSTT